MRRRHRSGDGVPDPASGNDRRDNDHRVTGETDNARVGRDLQIGRMNDPPLFVGPVFKREQGAVPQPQAQHRVFLGHFPGDGPGGFSTVGAAILIMFADR